MAWNDDMRRMACGVGGLLYAPALNPTTARHVLNGDWPCLTALSLCLEDSIGEAGLPAAEAQLASTLRQLRSARGARLPMIFVRVRSAAHLRHVRALLGEDEAALCGYIFPKCGPEDVDECFEILDAPGPRRERPLYGMPILESRLFASISTRRDALLRMRERLDAHADRVLNVRVGGNDFCNLYGLRRGTDQTIYDLGLVRDMLIDILNVFAGDYIVSGPVWEYYGDDPSGAWARGLRRELALDRANGFLGKTAIHPCQLPLIHESMKVSRQDAEDARRLLEWGDAVRGVAAGAGGRMNEVRTHTRWAEGIALRAAVYGVRDGK